MLIYSHKYFVSLTSFFVLNFLFVTNIYSQMDSIEYNYWQQIYDFKIQANEYVFKSWEGEVIETGKIIFDADLFFDNYQSSYRPEYIDSVQLAIVSRTLTNIYNEHTLKHEESFLRLCWFKDDYPTIIRLDNLGGKSIQATIKIGNGNFIEHGELLSDTTILLTKNNSKKINKLLSKDTDLINLSNAVICPSEIYIPNFFFEISRDSHYNIIVLSECYLHFSPYDRIWKIYKNINKVLKNMDYLGIENFSDGNSPKGSK